MVCIKCFPPLFHQVIFTNWDTQQPSQSVKELCVEMYGTGWSRRGKWNDEYCMKDNGFICQMPAGTILVNNYTFTALPTVSIIV